MHEGFVVRYLHLLPVLKRVTSPAAVVNLFSHVGKRELCVVYYENKLKQYMGSSSFH